MRVRKFPWVVLSVITLLFLAGCIYEGDFAESPSDGSDISGSSDSVVKEELSSIDDLHLRDKKLLYENQDPTDVVTMYLTVSTGNAAENTDHTWEEINSYSVYDYVYMGQVVAMTCSTSIRFRSRQVASATTRVTSASLERR